MRKIIFIVLGILLLSLIVLMIYVFGIKDRPASEEPDFIQEETFFDEEGLPENEGPFTRLTSYPVAGYRVLQNSVVVVGNDGIVEELDFTGTSIRELGLINLRGIVRAELDPTASTTGLLWVDQKTQEGRWYVWKSETGTLELLPASTQEVSFSLSGKMLRQEKGEERTSFIVVSGGRSQTVLTSSIPDLFASWVDDERLALLTRPSGLAPGILYLFNTRTRGTSRLLGNRFGLTARLSDGAEWTLFSETGQDGKGIQFKTLRGGEERVLRTATLPERCIFKNESDVICSIFDTRIDEKTMPDVYLRGELANSSSDIMEIELSNGEERGLFENIPLDATSLQVSKNSTVLFFINKKDGTLWRLSLE